ncbi:hypothetical protein ACFYP4_06835 [Streptomyces sp. NPDC005551]|uniref:hypothetical protein n=1 Tax=unclassified Streptomyces TaxID=2593676 RepID=UPI0033DE0F07
MRAMPARRIASSAFCATLLLGVAAPAAAAADGDSALGRAHAAAPVPGADGLLDQVAALAGLDGALNPVTDLLSAVLTTDDGRLSDDEAAALGDAAKTAIAEITEEATAEASADPVRDATTEPSDETPEVPGARDEDAADIDAADIDTDLLAELRNGLDNLLEVIDSGDFGKVVPAATSLVTGLVDVVVSTATGSGSTAASETSGLTDTLPGSSPLPQNELLSLLGPGARA